MPWVDSRSSMPGCVLKRYLAGKRFLSASQWEDVRAGKPNASLSALRRSRASKYSDVRRLGVGCCAVLGAAGTPGGLAFIGIEAGRRRTWRRESTPHGAALQREKRAPTAYSNKSS